jgi:hypothetical protein
MLQTPDGAVSSKPSASVSSLFIGLYLVFSEAKGHFRTRLPGQADSRLILNAEDEAVLVSGREFYHGQPRRGAGSLQ